MRKRKRSVNHWLLCICAPLLLIQPLRAADFVLQLRNGDRLTGSIVSESATELVLQTKSLGAIKIPIGEIKKRDTAAPTGSPPEDPLITSNTVSNVTPPAQAAPQKAAPAPWVWGYIILINLPSRV